MLTMEPWEFEKKLLKDNHLKELSQQEDEEEAFHFLKLENYIFRSQIDCYDKNLTGSKTFDLKTRATAAIRLDIENYQRYLDYRVDRLIGKFHSFEREFTDMLRGTFLKNSFQVRLGKMNGIFIAYHNTKTFHGFEYVSLEEMDRSVLTFLKLPIPTVILLLIKIDIYLGVRNTETRALI